MKEAHESEGMPELQYAIERGGRSRLLGEFGKRRERRFPEAPQIALVVATFAAVPYVHLQLEARRRFYPEAPLLVHDDHSPYAGELESLCRSYGADFEQNGTRLPPSKGDLSAFVGGLAWAHEQGAGLLVKLSRRFVPTMRWVDDLALREGEPEVEIIDCHYPLIHRSNTGPWHFIHGFAHDLSERLGIRIETSVFKGDIHLSVKEKAWMSQVQEITKLPVPFWIVAAGGKYDFTAKWRARAFAMGGVSASPIPPHERRAAVLRQWWLLEKPRHPARRRRCEGCCGQAVSGCGGTRDGAKANGRGVGKGKRPTFNFQRSTFNPPSDHGPRITDHDSRLSPALPRPNFRGGSGETDRTLFQRRSGAFFE